MNPRSIGIVGFGRFGALLGHSLRHDFTIRAYDALLTTEHITSNGIEAASLQDVCASDGVFLCVPIMKFEETVQSVLPFIQQGTAVLDVCSVKVAPTEIMRRYFGKNAILLPTHPMFGPISAQFGWDNLPFVLCPEATASPEEQALVSFWSDYIEHCQRARPIVMTPDEHDRTTAYNLCLTQLLGRVLGNIGIDTSPIDAQSFKYLMQMKEISYSDSMELLVGMHRFNPYASEMRQRLRDEFASLESQLTT